MSVHWLPVYRPSEAEQKDAALYASNVRKLLGLAIGITPTDHSFDDVLLMLEVRAGQVRAPGQKPLVGEPQTSHLLSWILR
jgi:hypothetical protein